MLVRELYIYCVNESSGYCEFAQGGVGLKKKKFGLNWLGRQRIKKRKKLKETGRVREKERKKD